MIKSIFSFDIFVSVASEATVDSWGETFQNNPKARGHITMLLICITGEISLLESRIRNSNPCLKYSGYRSNNLTII